MNMTINKVGNIEIEQNLLKFRMPITEFNTTDINEIEKNLKRKVVTIQSVPYYLIPSQVEIINSSVIFYYQLDNYKSFDFLRQLRFGEKLKYYTSLVEIAKRQESTKVLWNRYNFVLDPLEEKIKAILFETENIKIYEKTDAFVGIKELILISLTKLNSIYGKPTRTDFIDQDDYVIHFAETLLKIDNLDDLDDYINTKVIEFEHELSNVDSPTIEEVTSRTEKKKTLPFRFNKREKNSSSVNLKSPKTNKKKGKTKSSNKMIYIGVGALILTILITQMLPSPDKLKENKLKKESITSSEMTNNNPVNNEKKGKLIKETNSKYNSQLLEAYRSSLSGDSTNAINVLEGIGYNKLSEQDRTILLNIYQKNNMIHKVIDLAPSKAKDIVNEMIANGKENDLIKVKESMETSNPYIDFEVAYLKENWDQVIELKDKVDLNGRKEQQIVESYIALKKYKEGEQFAEKVGNPELLQSLKEMAGTN